MSRKQLSLLFIGILVPWTVGNGLLPLLPVYALRLGASAGMSGYYLSFSFIAIAIGTIFGGWLADRLQRRKLLLLVSGIILTPSIWLMGKASNVWHLVGATAAAWLSFGVSITIIITLAGLLATKEERGRVIGIIGMTMGLGSIIGGLSIGPMVQRWGYSSMFVVLSLFSIVLLISGVFIKDVRIDNPADRRTKANIKKLRFEKAFYVLLIAHFIVLQVNGAANMGRSLSMNNLGFTATAISSTTVFGGLFSLPIPFVLGWLSDRFGRKLMIAISYASYAICMAVLAISQSLWHFWIATIFAQGGMVSMSIGAAFITDLVKPKALGRGVSLFQSVHWIATATGYAIAGNAYQYFGVSTTAYIDVALPVIGIILIILIRVRKQEQAVVK